MTKGALLIGCGFEPTQSDVQNAIDAGDRENFDIVNTMSLDLEVDEKLALKTYLSMKRDNGWEVLNRLQVKQPTSNDGRQMWSIYPFSVCSFYLGLEYKQYLEEGRVDKKLIQAFEDNNWSLFLDEYIYKENQTTWEIRSKKTQYYISERNGQLHIGGQQLIKVISRRNGSCVIRGGMKMGNFNNLISMSKSGQTLEIKQKIWFLNRKRCWK